VGPNSAGNFFLPSQTVSLDTFANNSLFFQQDLDDGKFQFRIGRFQSASVFASLPAMGALPVNAAVNSTPTSLFLNVAGWHATSKPSWAAYAKVKPTEDTYFKAGIFQVNPQVNNPNYHGFAMGINRTDGTLLLAELGWTPIFNEPATTTPPAPAVNDGGKTAGDGGKTVMAPKPVTADTGLPGIYMVGAYLQNYPQVQWNGQTIYEVYGGYLQGQQMIWNNHANPKQNFNLWAGVTYSPQTQIAIMPVMGYGGVYFQGLIPGRDNDVSFLNFYTGNVSGSYAQQYIYNGKQPTEESVVELSYIVQLTDHFQFQPDLQYIIQPGGWSSIASSLVIGFQVSAQF
jgi:porin